MNTDQEQDRAEINALLSLIAQRMKPIQDKKRQDVMNAALSIGSNLAAIVQHFSKGAMTLTVIMSSEQERVHEEMRAVAAEYDKRQKEQA